ncbi:transposase [Actinospica sp. MGRD01-02]|uniref:Transposase n=1 Tax=Actinospica acidithermotolerans TaxID=2828514 RepID=A0A941EDP6_9ACTN|nr:transposase [Actinospica acidithermotolerans]MBR7829606.1 transposase [Actinospica acidithermotolerans]
MGRPSPYSEEFRADAVRLVLESTPPRSINEVASELGLNRETLRSWVRRSEKEAASLAAGGLTAAEREELARLRRRVKVLEEEKEILRKATQYFAREMNR